MEVIPKYVQKRYGSLKNGFQGAYSFIKNNKYKDSKKVLEALSDLRSYTLHKPVRLKHRRRPIICSHIDSNWAIDIIDFSKIKTKNRNFGYILLAVDCFSKFTFVEACKTKNAQSVLAAFKAIFKRSKRIPEKMYADRESAFLSKQLQQFFESHKIKLYHPISWLHASLAERYIKTFKTILARVWTHNNNQKWIGLEQEIALKMNNSVNRSIQMKPVQVNATNESIVWNNLYKKYINAKPKKPKLSVGDYVRISTRTLKDTFKKGYAVSWSEEVFKVKQVKGESLVPYYTLVDLEGEDIAGTYTDFDLQLVSSPNPADNGKL